MKNVTFTQYLKHFQTTKQQDQELQQFFIPQGLEIDIFQEIHPEISNMFPSSQASQTITCQSAGKVWGQQNKENNTL